VQGYYRRDHEAYAAYHRETKTREGYDRLARGNGSRGLPTWTAYVRRLGTERGRRADSMEHAFPEPVDYGY